MKLIVGELINSVQQEIEVTENLNVVAIRPHLYRHGNPAGSLKLQILDSNEKLITESETVDISDIGTLTYFHGYVRFNVNVALKSGSLYWVRLVGNGYTFNESAYVGWCNDYDLQKVDRTYTPNGDWQAALDLEIWTRTRKIRGA